MKNTFSVHFFIKKGVLKKNGCSPIIGRINVKGVKSQFNTQLEIQPLSWNIEQNKVIGRSNEANDINSKLDQLKSKVREAYFNLVQKNVTITSESVKNEFLGVAEETEKPTKLLDVVDMFTSDLQRVVGVEIKATTFQKYASSKNHITSFLKEKHNIDYPLKNINHQFIRDYEVYLRIEKVCGVNAAAKYLQKLKSIIYLALNNGWITNDPFFNFKIKKEDVIKDYLTMNELIALAQKELTNDRLIKVRDAFLFSCFTGLAYIDIKNIKKDNVQLFDGNKLWLIGIRVKTGTEYRVPLFDIPKSIIEKYKDKNPIYLLPISSNQKMNDYLKEIADLCGINKNLTYHVARHTFGSTITSEQDVPIESVSKMMGHKSIKTTQDYDIGFTCLFCSCSEAVNSG